MSLPAHTALPVPVDPEPSRTRRPRKERPRIELAPDQPLTTQGKPRARVYVACLQCRTRKIRCDGAKPTCHNCANRAMPANPCVYDEAPKRRGPDKTPGARQRITREARQEGSAGPVVSRRRRKGRDTGQPSQPLQIRPLPASPRASPIALRQPSLVLDSQLTDVPSAPSASPPPLHPGSSLALSVYDPPPQSHDTSIQVADNQALHDPLNFSSRLILRPPTTPIITPAVACVFDMYQDYDGDTPEDSPRLPSEPSLQFTRQTWWEALLTMYYSSFPSSFSTLLSKRQQAANHITHDLRFLFRSSNYWFSFINIPHFISIYLDPERRVRMQPSLLPAALAISTFFQSSEAGLGKQGRKMAMRLRDFARGTLEASINAGWIDEQVAQAAWLLAMFEVCAHPDHTSERCASALVALDTIIRSRSLTLIDLEHPASTNFSPRSVPSVRTASQYWASDSSLNASVANIYAPNSCSCASKTLGQCWSAAHDYSPLWVSSPAWDSCWSEAEIRKETCRRLCWSALLLTAGHTFYAAAINRPLPDLFVLEPANFALLFPGEILHSSRDGPSGKDTIWSLNYRSTLLWHSCLRMRSDPGVSESEIARFALEAWLEADALERALDSHVCDLERTFLFHGRECLFNVRLIIVHDFRRLAPLALGEADYLFRKKAEDWLIHQANVAQRVVQSLAAVTGHASIMLMHRPFFVFWFMSQINRALTLWKWDRSLTLALDVCITLFEPVDYLSALWPCPEQRRRSQMIREQVASACREAGRTLPPDGWGVSV